MWMKSESDYVDNVNGAAAQSDLVSLDNDEIEMRDRMEKIRMQETEVVNMMAKISLLTIVCEIFINIYLIILVYLNLEDVYQHDTLKAKYMVIMGHFALIIGYCVNCFTLYAAFVFNGDHYMICCAFCHKSLKKCCVMCVTRQAFRYTR